MSTITRDPADVLDTIARSNRFLIQQVFKPIGNEYRISAPPAGDDEAEPLLFVKQKKLAIKEDIRFRLSPDDDEYLFMIKSKSVFEFRGRHEVLDSLGGVLGMLEKDFAKSLLRSYWHVRDAAGLLLFDGFEKSLPIAIIRRVGQYGPDWLAPAQWLPFNFVLTKDGEVFGHYRRVLGKLRDRYVLELEPALQDVDRRLVLAFAVALDALQDR